MTPGLRAGINARSVVAQSAKRRRKCQGGERVRRSRCSHGMDVTPAEVDLGFCGLLWMTFIARSKKEVVELGWADRGGVCCWKLVDVPLLRLRAS